MRRSFIAVPAPVLTGVVREATTADAICAIKNYTLHGAQGIDLHLSCLNEASRTPEELAKIAEASALPIFGLNYCQNLDWSLHEASEQERVELMLRAVEAGFSGLDMQGYTFDPAAKTGFRDEYKKCSAAFAKYAPKEVTLDETVVARQCELVDKVHAMGGEVILSNHIGTYMDSDALVELCRLVERRNPDTIKIVSTCDTEQQLAETVRAMLRFRTAISVPVTLICTGRFRALSRILNPLLGGYMVFTTDAYTPFSNLGQIDLTAIRAIIENANRLTMTLDSQPIPFPLLDDNGQQAIPAFQTHRE